MKKAYIFKRTSYLTVVADNENDAYDRACDAVPGDDTITLSDIQDVKEDQEPPRRIPLFD